MWIWVIFSEENLAKMIVAGVPTLLIALVIPFISIRFAMKQFYSQKWWEQKSKAYNDIIELLSECHFAVQGMIGYDIKPQNINGTTTFLLASQEPLIELYNKTIDEIKKQRFKAEFLLHSAAVNLLYEFVDGIEGNRKYFPKNEFWYQNLEVISITRREIKIIAEKDLRVKMARIKRKPLVEIRESLNKTITK